MRIDTISVFPAYFEPLELSLIGRAIADGQIEVAHHDLRDFTHDRHRTVDDTPYGGGPGMVMKPEPWGEALDHVLASGIPDPVIVVPTPSGRTFTQAVAAELAARDHLVFACGRYEGIDSRVAQSYSATHEVAELSIGDFVVAGGEVATLVIIETVARLIPGVLGNQQSVADDSFAVGRTGSSLEGPIYTKPRTWRGSSVPEVLLSGNHEDIAEWRREQSKHRTEAYRPDLR